MTNVSLPFTDSNINVLKNMGDPLLGSPHVSVSENGQEAWRGREATRSSVCL